MLMHLHKTPSEHTPFDRVLEEGLQGLNSGATPPRLREAIRYAVFPTGACLRPSLCMEVAKACAASPEAFQRSPGFWLAEAAAASLEFVHCASLVHDDLPCFDDASLRRGRPALHRVFGEDIAVLTGDALIVLAFASLARRASFAPERIGLLMTLLSSGVGPSGGIIGGQAWESEPGATAELVRRMKTGALLAAAAGLGAAAMGVDPRDFSRLGMTFGEAYQVADDLMDLHADEREVGKTVGRDAALDRPSTVRQLGEAGAWSALIELKDRALASVPECPGQQGLRLWTASAFGLIQRRLRSAVRSAPAACPPPFTQREASNHGSYNPTRDRPSATL